VQAICGVEFAAGSVGVGGTHQRKGQLHRTQSGGQQHHLDRCGSPIAPSHTTRDRDRNRFVFLRAAAHPRRTTGTTGKSNQLALFDRRIQERVVQLGWTPQTAVSMSQFIHPAWSPCGTLVSSYGRLLLARLCVRACGGACALVSWCLTRSRHSGSTDPTIHMFDVRYARVGKPSFSVAAHGTHYMSCV
jgi:hypothetical protein